MYDPNRPRPFLRPAAPRPAAALRPDGTWKALALIGSVLDGQQVLEPDDRNQELIDVLLDVRNLLRVPVVPGRSS